VQGLPVNGRQMSQLMLQAPGSQNAGTGTWGDIRFSGRAVEQNVIKYDGVEASGIIDSAPGVANGENASLFKLQASLENVQEFRVESSGYPAEFGTGTGGQVSVITKSGTNQFHGSIFEYLRNDRARRGQLLRLAAQRRRQRHQRRRAARRRFRSRRSSSISSGGSFGRPAREGPGVLLRQLRGVSPRRRQEHHSGSAERRRVGRAVPGRGGAPLRLPGSRRKRPGRCLDEPGQRHRPVAGHPAGARERV
jgi:hypothetical protein